MNRIHFDSQKLPPFLVGYFVDSKIGEREIAATLVGLSERGNLHIFKQNDAQVIARMPGKRPQREFEALLWNSIPEVGIPLREAMKRIDKEKVFSEFTKFVKNSCLELTTRNKSRVFAFFNISFVIKRTTQSGDAVIRSELKKTFGEDKILPLLPPGDGKSLLELVDFLKAHPASSVLGTEFLAYRVALGLDSYWMDAFGADAGQRYVVEEAGARSFPVGDLRENARKNGSPVSFRAVRSSNKASSDK